MKTLTNIQKLQVIIATTTNPELKLRARTTLSSLRNEARVIEKQEMLAWQKKHCRVSSDRPARKDEWI